MNGILNVCKEKGYTSHDAVAKLRGILHEKKIGHTGTLDPDAEGVLPVCVGRATKVCDLLTDWEKTYRTVLLLGVTTDTQDCTGSVLREAEAACTEEEVRRCAGEFVGELKQIPPMYSAVRVQGKRLYELARAGVEVERKARTVTIKEIRIDWVRLPRVGMTVRCSKGTYIRTLCHDIGEKLGCGGCMEELVRTQAGPFVLSESKKLSEIESLRDEGRLSEILLPIDSVFKGMDRVALTPEAEKLVRNGNPLSEQMMLRCSGLQKQKAPGEPQQVRVYAQNGEFLAVYEYKPERKNWRLAKLFA